jgi:hypothetical protein
VFDEPAPPLPADGEADVPPTDPVEPRLPVRTPRPIADVPTRSLFGEALGDDEVPVRPEREAHQRDTAAFARIVKASQQQDPSAGLPSALDLDDSAWQDTPAAAPATASEPGPADEVEDDAARPDRSLARVAAAVGLVLLLVVIGWALAVAL